MRTRGLWSVALIGLVGVARAEPPGTVVPAGVKFPPIPAVKPPAPLPPLPAPPASAVPPLPIPLPAPTPVPALPPPPGLAPPAPPAKSAPAAQPAPPPVPDFNLRPGNTGNSVKLDAPPAYAPVPPRPAMPAPAVPASRSPDPAPLPRAVLAPPADEPAPTPGDPTVTRTPAALAAVLGAAFALAPTATPAADPPEKKTVEDRLTEIERKLARLVEAVEGRKDEKGFTVPTDPGVVAKVKDLGDDVKALKDQMADMKKTTVALRPAADPMAGKGTVRIDNQYPAEVTVRVNATSYRVPANTKLDVTVPAGLFTYELLSGADPVQQTATVDEKKSATLRVRP